MREIVVSNGETIKLGKQGENLALVVKFETEDWEETYGSGTFALLVQRPGESETYYAELDTETYEGYVAWVVESTDLVNAGNGYCELQYTVDETVAKSATYKTMVKASLGG